jgi:hypothetical protein
LRASTDEIDEQMEEVSKRAQALEAAVTGNVHSADQDSVSTYARDLANRALALEKEIASGRAAGAN